MPNKQIRLDIHFYNRPVVEVARDLLGKKLVFKQFEGIITETEAYGGFDDEASHSFKGKTPRSAIMFGPAGFVYVYLIYGRYYCFNIVTEEEGKPSAVLIRGLQLPHINLDGPGKICRYLGLNMEDHGTNLLTHPNFYLTSGIVPKQIAETPRIGIKKAADKPWRFVL